MLTQTFQIWELIFTFWTFFLLGNYFCFLFFTFTVQLFKLPAKQNIKNFRNKKAIPAISLDLGQVTARPVDIILQFLQLIILMEKLGEKLPQ